jgi:hypothetical protein
MRQRHVYGCTRFIRASPWLVFIPGRYSDLLALVHINPLAKWRFRGHR